MMSRSILAMLVCATAPLGFWLCFGADDSGDKKNLNINEKQALQLLKGSDEQKQKAAAKFFMRERKRRIAGLISVIKSKEMLKRNPRAVEEAIKLLGHLRAKEAAPTLADLHHFLSLDTEYRRLPIPTKEHPALGALVRIGKPGVKAILDKLKEKKPGKEKLDELRAYLMLPHAIRIVLYDVEGVKLAIVILEDRLEHAESKYEQKVLTDSLKTFTNW